MTRIPAAGLQIRFRSTLAAWLLIALAVAIAPARAEEAASRPAMVVDGVEFETWSDYATSDYFRAAGLRCATPDRDVREMLFGPLDPVPSDWVSNSSCDSAS